VNGIDTPCAKCSLGTKVDPARITVNPDWPEDSGRRVHYHNACWSSLDKDPTPDPVNHPDHYTWLPNGVEVIDITKHLPFCLGNVVKYTLRADRKGRAIEDLKKAQTYLRYEIERREEIARRESGV
jgi:hypothetical protein